MDEKGATSICPAFGTAGSPDPVEAGLTDYLIVVRGGTPGALIRLTDGPIRLGRAADNTWQLADASISRHHAIVEPQGEGSALLTDLGSTNGTFLNGRRLSQGLAQPLRDGDRVQLGASLVVKFIRPDSTEEHFQRELFDRAVRDGLTGLYNRAYFLEQVATLATQIAGRGLGLALILLDVDHFKRVNDRFGHDAGDTVLREVAQILRKATRPEDLVARYGGEEFVAALPVATPDQATGRAERIRESLGSRRIVLGKATIRVTASIGLAYNPPDLPRAVSSMLSAADRSLYVAKEAGRNRVVFGTDPADEPQTTCEYACWPPLEVEK